MKTLRAAAAVLSLALGLGVGLPAAADGDSTPDPFTFPTLENVPLLTVVTSSLVPTGFDSPALVLVVGGTYSVGCTGSYTLLPGIMQPGESICVRHLSASLLGRTVTTLLTIGGVTGSFSSITTGAGGPPGAPTIGVATAQIESAVVTFTPPDNDGGLAILDYTATCGDRSASATSSPVNVTGIVTHTPITCTVTARNSAGTGPASAPSNAVLPTTSPAAPTAVVAQAGPGSVTVSFQAPDNGGSAIQVYEATCGTGVRMRSASPIIVTGLQPGVAVACTVRAMNAVNFGPASAASNTVVPTTLPSDRSRSDLNGDGKADLVFEDATGNIAAWTMNGTGVFDASGLLPAGSGWTVALTADFNGDGKADILLRHTDGRVLMWIMNGVAVANQVQLRAAGSVWIPTHAGDLNGDGKADILWQNANGTVSAWLMDGGTTLQAQMLQAGSSGWHITHVADLDGDGKSDLLWQHTNGQTVAWIMDGLALVSSAGFTPGGSGWSITHTGDFNGDGRADLVFRNTDGSMMLWVMNGTALDSFAALQNAGTPWRIDLVGDLDGDGKSDLIWRNTVDGSTYATLMNGTTTMSAGFLFGAASGWTATHLRDLNGDGRKDILWRYMDGTLATWIMNGLSVIDAAGLIGPSTWQIVPIPGP